MCFRVFGNNYLNNWWGKWSKRRSRIQSFFVLCYWVVYLKMFRMLLHHTCGILFLFRFSTILDFGFVIYRWRIDKFLLWNMYRKTGEFCINYDAVEFSIYIYEMLYIFWMMYIVFFLVDLYKYFYNFVCDAYLNYFSNNRHLDLNIYYVVIYLYYLTLYIFKFFKGNFHYIFKIFFYFINRW